MTAQRLCAVFGDPIDHSLSPMIHHQFAEQCDIDLLYEKKQVKPSQFSQAVADFFAQGGLGLNITLPLKSLAYEMADIIKPEAQQAKAANTLWIEADKLVADNTDGLGLVTDIGRFCSLVNQRIHIIGAGGAARGIIQPLQNAGITSISLSNRTFEKAQILQEEFPFLTILPWQQPLPSIDILINATSASTTSQPASWPVLNNPISLAYDLAYQRQYATPFMMHYQPMANQCVDGMGMLIEQAALAFQRWHHILPDTSIIRSQLRGN